jgi:hypothetical protein
MSAPARQRPTARIMRHELATRYHRLAANYLAFVQLASIRLWLLLNESVTEEHSADQFTPPSYPIVSLMKVRCRTGKLGARLVQECFLLHPEAANGHVSQLT